MRIDRITFLLFLIFISFSFAQLAAQRYEADYIRLLSQKLGGQTEVSVYGGRVDIVTSSHAIEVEFASKWKHAIGQSIWYAMQTNKRPGIVLIKRSNQDNKYVIMLQSALNYAGLNTKVWVYPDDFQSSGASIQHSIPGKPSSGGTCWKTTSSGTRHNASCRYFENTRGAFVGCEEGIACKICGG